MKPTDLKKFWGTQKAIADALGCEQPSVAGWFARGEVPEGRQYQTQLATNGALVADKPALRNAPSGPGEKRRSDRRAGKDRREKA